MMVSLSFAPQPPSPLPCHCLHSLSLLLLLLLLRFASSGMIHSSGFPVDRYSRKHTMIAYWGMGTFWGNARANNNKGHLIGHIKASAAPSSSLLLHHVIKERQRCQGLYYVSASQIANYLLPRPFMGRWCSMWNVPAGPRRRPKQPKHSALRNARCAAVAQRQRRHGKIPSSELPLKQLMVLERQVSELFFSL